MKFSDYTYTRPNYDVYKQEVRAEIQRLTTASSLTEAVAAVKHITALAQDVDTQMNLASIRHTIDTTDSFYEQEDTYWNEYGPLYTELNVEYYRAVLDSPYQEALAEILPETFFKMAEFELRSFSPAVIDLLQKENDLASQYTKLVASAKIEYDGKILTLSQFGPYLESKDRDVRKSASQASWSFFEEHEAEFDRIYDEMVEVRTNIAHTLGFKDFVELSYIRMMRFDYDRDMVHIYRENVLADVVPAATRLYERQAKRIGLESMRAYDLPLNFLEGNAAPTDTPEVIVQNGQKMYHELSPETGEFIDFMVERDLLDLLSTKGKASGGYCTYIPEYESPFIFANFNGTSGDIDVLTHEAGHAFQVYESRWIQQPELVFPTYESAEIHSMSMEFFTYPWMELFFKEDTDKYKFSHLSGALQFLPYGVLVDHFQHEVYENPTMTPEERKATWRRLEKMYNPHKDYSEQAFLEKGTYWYRQGHIFQSPFYYIDYTLAQVCAFQFWKRAIFEKDPTAWDDYLSICKVGGSKTFLQIVEQAHLVSPFEEGSLTEIVQTIETELEKVDDLAL